MPLPVPIVLDTDIGTDIDDAYALLFAAVSPELELRAVTTVNNGVVLRAQIAKKLLRLLGQEVIPVAVGASAALSPGVHRGWGGHEGKGIELSDIAQDRDFDLLPAARLIAEHVEQAFDAGTPLTLLTIGALTNAALACRAFPEAMAKTGRIVAMASSFAGYGEENAQGEHNVACDPQAFQVVLDSGIPLTLIGLNVTRQTRMIREQVDALEQIGGSLAEALVGMHRIWFEFIKRDHSPMHDGLAIAATFRPELVRLVPVIGHVLRDNEENGIVVYNPPPPPEVTENKSSLASFSDLPAANRVQIADWVDVEAFHALFYERINAAVAQRRNT